MKRYIKSSTYILHGGLDSQGYWVPLGDEDYNSVEDAKNAVQEIINSPYFDDICQSAMGEWVIEESGEYGEPTGKIVARGKFPRCIYDYNLQYIKDNYPEWLKGIRGKDYVILDRSGRILTGEL